MPFAVTGTISGVPRFSPGAPPLFTTSVFGSGTTSLTGFRRFDEEGGAVYRGVSGQQSIVFADQVPVPEPGTLLLCASGAAALYARRRRKAVTASGRGVPESVS